MLIAPSELDDLVQRIAEDPANSKTRTTVRLGVCGSRVLVLKCLAGGDATWKRALSGLSITGALSERPAVLVGNGLLPEPSFAGHYGVTGQIDFNPANLFITGANWSKAIKAAQNISMERGELEKTVAAITKQRPWSAFVQAAVPTFQFKRTSQFDFVKYGGTLIAAPFPESALNSYKFIWDLKKVISATSTRVAAAEAVSKIASYQDPQLSDRTDGAYEPDTASEDRKLCIIYSGSLRSSISVPNGFKVDSCAKFAKDIGADRYALACVSENGIVIGNPYETGSAIDQKLKVDLRSCNW